MLNIKILKMPSGYANLWRIIQHSTKSTFTFFALTSLPGSGLGFPYRTEVLEKSWPSKWEGRQNRPLPAGRTSTHAVHHAQVNIFPLDLTQRDFTMRVVMLFILLCIKLGYPKFFKFYEFLKNRFQPFRRNTKRKRCVCSHYYRAFSFWFHSFLPFCAPVCSCFPFPLGESWCEEVEESHSPSSKHISSILICSSPFLADSSSYFSKCSPSGLSTPSCFFLSFSSGFSIPSS